MSESAADPREALLLFQQFLEARGLSTETMKVRDGVQAVFDFFRSQRFVSDRGDEDDDMLLLQCGTYNWGNGRHFDFTLTRQLIFDDHAHHNGSAIWQLNLTFHFPPDPEREEVQADWLSYSPDGADEYEAFVRESEPFRMLADESPEEVELLYEDVC